VNIGRGRVHAVNAKIGEGVTIEGCIGTHDRPVKDLIIGDHTYIGPGVRLDVPRLHIGDYTKIHQDTVLYGKKPVTIGHNVWVGQNCYLDAEGDLQIEDNVGIGAYSQVWSHIRHGDTMMGCRLLKYRKTLLDHDSWLVGRCSMSPCTAEPFSVALLGSVVTKDMKRNTIYAGVPAKPLQGEPPYRETYPADRMLSLKLKMDEFGASQALRGVVRFSGDPTATEFNVKTRTYTKRGTKEEVAFMKFLLPEIKFVPHV